MDKVLDIITNPAVIEIIAVLVLGIVSKFDKSDKIIDFLIKLLTKLKSKSK